MKPCYEHGGITIYPSDCRDRTWNPITGCTKVSPGCKNCYAEAVAERFWAKQYPGRRGFAEVRCHPDRLDGPLRWRKPQRIFVNSMSDLFHEDVPDQFIDRVFAVMLLSPRHTFQVLTKRPERMCAYLSDPALYDRVLRTASTYRCERQELYSVGISNPNRGFARWIWLGVSIENQETADERIPLLLQTPAAVHWISAEPLLGEIDLRQAVNTGEHRTCSINRLGSLAWCVTGGESGPGARPCDVAWIRSIVEQCKAADVPCFLKQMGTRVLYHRDEWREWQKLGARFPVHDAPGEHRLILRDRKGGDPSEWPKDLRIRQWPETTS